MENHPICGEANVALHYLIAAESPPSKRVLQNSGQRQVQT
jgi:hypothetical protein